MVTKMVPSKRRHLPDRNTQCRDTEGDNENLHRIKKFKFHYLHAVPKTVTQQTTSPHTRKRLNSNMTPQEKSIKRP